MAVGKETWPQMHSIQGVELGVASAGIKTGSTIGQRDDILLVAINEGATVAGTFTKNAFCAAPVTVARDHLKKEACRYFLINSGNANACTGEQGMADALASCAKVSELTGVVPESVIPFSTGVIGEFLPMDRLNAAVPKALENLSQDNWGKASRAIMTTDTRPKGASVKIELGEATVTITGIAKGAGMIRPNMATMLAYVATDAKIEQSILDELLLQAVNKSFNRITVDGDTSTNDACMLIASGCADAPAITENSGEYFEQFKTALVDVLQQLAQSIIKDAEGATKFVAINVANGVSNEECLQVAYAIAHSPLVKTAIFASDPNWGRIVAAIGYAGIPELDASKIKVWLDDVLIVENGSRAASYEESLGVEVVEKDAYTIKVSLSRGESVETVWTSDLSHEYVTINAEYRT